MSHPGLLTLGRTEVDRRHFIFTHAMQHRALLAVMHPLSRFSAYPYMRFFDPMINTSLPASDWHLAHQSAHRDAQSSVPSYYASPNTGLFISGNLIDYNLADNGMQQWWLLQNHHEHYVMAQAVNPLPAPPPATQPTFPFW